MDPKDQILLLLDKMERAGGMRECRPSSENLARRLGMSVPEVHRHLLELRREKRVRWRGRFAPLADQPITVRRNPDMYGPPPPVGWALGQLAAEGFTAARFIREDTGRRGPVLVFRAHRQGEEVVVNVGRVSGDVLQVLWRPLNMRGRVNPSLREELDGKINEWGWEVLSVQPVGWCSFKVAVLEDGQGHGPYEVLETRLANGTWQSGPVRWLSALEVLALVGKEP